MKRLISRLSIAEPGDHLTFLFQDCLSSCHFLLVTSSVAMREIPEGKKTALLPSSSVRPVMVALPADANEHMM